jgi:hypothetical protein
MKKKRKGKKRFAKILTGGKVEEKGSSCLRTSAVQSKILCVHWWSIYPPRQESPVNLITKGRFSRYLFLFSIN